VRFVLIGAMTGVTTDGCSASASRLALETGLSRVGESLQGSAVLSGILAKSEVHVRWVLRALGDGDELVLLVEQGGTELVLALRRSRLDLLFELRGVSLVELQLLSVLIGLAETRTLLEEFGGSLGVLLRAPLTDLTDGVGRPKLIDGSDLAVKVGLRLAFLEEVSRLVAVTV
jgi:hypothetical protein